MRLAVTSSSIRSSSLAIGVSFLWGRHPEVRARSPLGCVRASKDDGHHRGRRPSRLAQAGEHLRVTEREFGVCSQNKTHRAERAELVRVDDHAALLDAEGIARALEDMAIATDVFPDAL